MLNFKDVNLNTKTKPNKNLIFLCNLLTYCNKKITGYQSGPQSVSGGKDQVYFQFEKKR